MQRRLVEPFGTRAHLVGARVDSGVTLRLTQCGDQAIGAAERGAYARHGTAHGRAVDAHAEDRRQHRVRVRDRTEMQQVVTADGAAMAMLISFFLAGSLATKFKKQRKAQLLANASLPESQQEEDASDAHRGRTAQQVVATGGIPALLCLVCRVHACCGCVGYVYAQSTCTTRPATSDLPNGG